MCERFEASCSKSYSLAIATKMLKLVSQLVYVRETPSFRQ